MATPVRVPRPGDDGKPVYVVWEVTLKCDHACSHCGSRAVRARPDELSTDELLEVAASLVRLGTREVTLIGGEAYLRDDVYQLVRFLADAGVRVGMQTGGRGLTAERCRALADAGMAAVGVSVDGPPEVHDLLRASPGSHAAAMTALGDAARAGMVTSSNTQVNRLSWHFLEQVYQTMQDTGVRAWRCQLTVPMGRAAEHPEWLLEPWRVIEVIDTLASLQHDANERARVAGHGIDRAMNVCVGNNLGYFGPHEALLRGHPGSEHAHWTGCAAGRFTLGIESDGTVKGCPSLPTAPYTAGNVRQMSLDDLLETPEVRFTRDRSTDEMWGFCGGCHYRETCRAGCSWTAHTTLGRRGNMPWCYHRATTLRRQGQRERLERVEAPPGVPYDFGRFELVTEPCE